jgi:hypothetical protein
VGHSASAVHRDPGRLVDGDEGVVLEEDRELEVRRGADSGLSATRIGGMRMRSPASTRLEASTRPLFTRTSPLRRIR